MGYPEIGWLFAVAVGFVALGVFWNRRDRQAADRLDESLRDRRRERQGIPKRERRGTRLTDYLTKSAKGRRLLARERTEELTRRVAERRRAANTEAEANKQET